MSASKKKGTAAESAVAGYLRTRGYAAERRALAGIRDRGDIAGIPGLVIEVKNCAEMRLSAWLTEAWAETEDGELGVVWHKRRGFSGPGEWYVTMDGATFVSFLEAWTRAVAD